LQSHSDEEEDEEEDDYSSGSHGGVRLAHFLVPNPRPFFKSGVLYNSNKQSIELQNSVQNAFPMHYSWW
jgi:hypothetical protein